MIGVQFIFFVAHAPTTANSDGVVQRWREASSSIVLKHRRAGDVVIALCDANARIGSETSPSVGSL